MRWPLQPLQPFQQTQLQPPFGQSVDSLCHPWFTTTNVSYRFPILKLPPPPRAVLLVNKRKSQRIIVIRPSIQGVSIKMLVPQNYWFRMENPKIKLMIWGSPISETLQIWVVIWDTLVGNYIVVAICTVLGMLIIIGHTFNLGYNSWYVDAYFDPYSGIVLVTTGLEPNISDKGFIFSPLNPYCMPYLCPCTCTSTFEFSPPWSTLIFRIILIGNGPSLYSSSTPRHAYDILPTWGSHPTITGMSSNKKTGLTWEYQHDVSCKVRTPTTRVWLQYDYTQ